MTAVWARKHLGGLAPHGEDKTSPAGADLVTTSGPLSLQIPAVIRWDLSVALWPMDNNDTQPDCTAAAVAHAIQQWSLYGQGVSKIMTSDKTLAFFGKVQAPGQEGAYLINVLTYWRDRGVDTGFGIDRIEGFAQLTSALIPWSTSWFGNAFLVLALPLYAQAMADDWIIPDGITDLDAGSWGVHCIIVVGADQDWLYFVSWGKLMRMTRAFMQAYFQEAYAVLSRLWVKVDGYAPSGASLAFMRGQLKALPVGGNSDE